VVYASGATEHHMVKLDQPTTEVVLPTSAPVRGIELNRDEQALVVVERAAVTRSSTAAPDSKRTND
jgi:hypothetical protein